MKTIWLLALLATAGMISAASAQRVAVVVDATKPGAPITRLTFGGFMEPATTAIWAEMLSDRKFFYEINSKPDQDPEPPARASFRMGRIRRWKPVGADSSVVMDREHAYSGDHSPRVQLEGATLHGISQSGLSLRAGKEYVGRVVLAGGGDAKVDVSLIWGPNPGDRATLTFHSLSGEYKKLPLKFTVKTDSNEGRFEIVGTGSGAFHAGAASLMPADNVEGYRLGTIRMLKEQGVTLLRWPGGNFVSGYDWRDGIGDSDQRPPRMDPAWHRVESNDMGIDEFMALCRLLGAEPYIAVNTGFGDAHSALDELQYVNGPAETPMGKWRAFNGHREPYNVTIWGIGNEMYGPWQVGYMSLKQYWEKHILFVKEMKKADPRIKVIASSAMIEEMSWCAADQEQFSTAEWRGRLTKKVPFEYGSHEDWTGGLLANAAEYIDYLGEHFYAYPAMAFDAATQRFDDAASDSLADKVRRLPNKVAYKFEAWEEYLKRIPSLKGKDIRFAFDEWSPRFRSATPPPGGGRASGGMIGPLSLALTYHEFFRHSGMVALGVNTGGMTQFTVDAAGDAAGFRVEGFITKVLHDHFADALPVVVSGDSPQHPIKGTVGVDTSEHSSGSPTYPLDVFAALSADRKKLVVSVVNPTEGPQEADLRLDGVQASGGVKLWQIAAPNVNAVNMPGQKPLVDLVQIPVSAVPSKLTLPPVSVSVYEFELR